MGNREYQWQLREEVSPLGKSLSKELGVMEPVAQLLINRGIEDAVEGNKFLYPSLNNLYSPELMKDLASAGARIKKALQQGEKILVYGDYDVDGITGTALLVSFLQKQGGQVSYYIPNRFNEGYGLNVQALKKIRDEGVNLVITVDCGISSKKEVEYARSLGLEVIITDHHTPPPELPSCLILNPLQKDCPYPWKKLAGVGVAFKLVQFLLSEGRGEEYMDLVTLGTVGDVASLLEENRVLVKYGMERINWSPGEGIKALKDVSGFAEKEISSCQLSYSLIPRLNAAGRMGSAGQAVELLLTDYPEKAREIAEMLDKFNRERQQVENGILEKARQEVEEKKLYHNKAIVLAGENWHPGVTGIVASRLVDLYYRPVVLISLEGEEGRGSGRSIEGFNMIEAVSQCGYLLTRYGGHEQACGLTLPRENLEEFRMQLNNLAEEKLSPSLLVPRLHLEAELEAEDISLELLDQLRLLEPFGQGNPLPLFKSDNLEIEDYNFVGKNKNHLKLRLRGKKEALEGIFFNMEEVKDSLDHRQVSAAFILDDNNWGDFRTPVLQLKDFYFTDYINRGGLTIVDRRQLVKKDNYLRSLVLKSKTLAYVNSCSQQKRLVRVAGNTEKLLCSHQGSINQDILGDIEHLVIYDLPLEHSKFISFLRDISVKISDISIHFIYGSQDLKNNMVFLQAFLPCRSSLVKIYQVIKAIAEKEIIDLNRLRISLKELNGFPFTEHLFKKSLKVFEEINLIKPLPRDKGERWAQVSSRQVGELSESPLYVESQHMWRELEKFQTLMLEADKDGLISLIFEGEDKNLSLQRDSS
ncbi:MAG: single-stranded-DNA-specific exonuclease RecJ [Candidatus Syntrophonatronum acetioxidans]|uniref:Single-stranded-DNA-specific exonuclease RecJ n=1 Tax=Candidatus Syntrophonatronum acetioxidans TaxID=1795816 RepID=A0A424YIM0_9FIRM|nr:MAG: single-stranded-DNA-specific exonuclease RecJ [Candidatus Syntrophonatronum acetioxidans]